MSLDSEIHEQPEVLGRLIEQGWPKVQSIAASLRREDFDHVLIIARGTSDNAGLYARYLFGVRHQLPVTMAMPSLVTRYGRGPRLKRTLVIAISQSGRSPDLIATLEAAAEQGAPTVVITNAPDSPLAAAGRHVLAIGAGPERAVAATKTYSAQLAALALLSTALEGDPAARRELDLLPEAVRTGLESAEAMSAAAKPYASMEQGVVLGRGFHYATAYEWSLKLKELCYVVVAPYSSADFRHGPIAIVDPGFPVFAVVSRGPVAGDMVDLLQELRRNHGARSLVISNEKAALAEASTAFALPDVPEWLAPISAIVPAQLFTAALTRLKGLDPENPRGLSKITATE